MQSKQQVPAHSKILAAQMGRIRWALKGPMYC